jgi:transposase-like protein
MSRRYTPEEKAAALQHLNDNYGNITLTAMQTSIPVRTLHHWRRERKLQLLANISTDNEDEALESLLHKKVDVQQQQEVYTRLHQTLLEHLFNLTETLLDDPDTAHLRITALARLLDRVIKLEDLAKSEQYKLETKRYHEMLRQYDSIHDIIEENEAYARKAEDELEDDEDSWDAS